MFLGHFAVALAAKRASREVSLGTTILAAQLLDVIWPVLLLVGVERVRIVPGLMAASPLDFVHYPISHSLVAAAGWGLLAGGIYLMVRRSAGGAVLVGGLVLSHWFLDAPMHRPDLPLWPGSEVRVGGGLWDSVALSLSIELLLLAAGLGVYLVTTRARDRFGSLGLAGMVALLVVFYAGSLFGPPPPGERALAVSALGLWLVVPWGYWVDRHRVPRDPAAAPRSAGSRRAPAAAGRF